LSGSASGFKILYVDQRARVERSGVPPSGSQDEACRRKMKNTFDAGPIDILLVEDDAGEARLAQCALGRGGIYGNIYHVEDGVEAMRFLRRQENYADVPLPDLILLDLNLPRKDGREVLAEIKEDPELRLIPVVVLTTSETEQDVAETYRLHANAYIVKPVDLDGFIEVVRSIKDFWFSTAKLPGSGGG
jgi:chemotaxis family two-component system response regulator Rcp1